MTEPPDLRNWLNWVNAPDCTCGYEWKSLGRLDGQSMGSGWVRMDTDPSCEHHAPKEPQQ